jgi:hypothetical protein
VNLLVAVGVFPFLASDAASGGRLGAASWGALKGAGQEMWKTETTRARSARAARRLRNSKTRLGRAKNTMGEEFLVFFGALGRGARNGARTGIDDLYHRRREAAVRADAARQQATADAGRNMVPCPGCRGAGCDWCAGDGVVPRWTVDPRDGVIPGPEQAEAVAGENPCGLCGARRGPNGICLNSDCLERLSRCRRYIDQKPPTRCGNPTDGGLFCTECDGALGLKPNLNEPPAAPAAGDSTPNGEPTVADTNTAPEVIAAWEGIFRQLETTTDELVALAPNVAQVADSMGDFSVGSENDASEAIARLSTGAQAALEEVERVIAELKREFGASIEAADGKKAAAHQPMQVA